MSYFPDNSTGTYTPTVTNVTNMAALTASLNQWWRQGDRVYVSGRVGVDATTTNTDSAFTMTLPIASAIGNDYEVAGMASNAAFSENYSISGDVAGDTARFDGRVNTALAHNVLFSFMYAVL